MDYQNDIVDMVSPQEQAPLLDHAATLLTAAHEAGLPVIYVVVRFRDGYPEVSPLSPRFASLKQTGRMREGTPGAEIHARVAPKPGDIVVTKRRTGAPGHVGASAAGRRATGSCRRAVAQSPSGG